MNEEQRENLDRLVNELDGIVPREGAIIKMVIYGGGPDESRMIGNETGYLRLGIELLKGTLDAQQDTETDTRSLAIELNYLEADDSTIYFSDFMIDDKLRTEVVMPDSSKWQKVKDRLYEIAMSVFMLFLLGAYITGIATILIWIIGFLKSA